uniref:Uncharacterized protein n=1 Tax=Salvator merianae TaxID=96440 RepID=A0A8D0BGQ7_SALMN
MASAKQLAGLGYKTISGSRGILCSIPNIDFENNQQRITACEEQKGA